MKLILLTLLSCFSSQLFSTEPAPGTGESLIEFTSAEPETKGQKVNALAGEFKIQEQRNHSDSRMLSLHYVRFPSTNPNPGPPIVYLAGGPGGSGISTAQNRRFALFMALREVADVIALDQRGTGQSNDLPDCDSDRYVPQDRPIDEQAYLSLQQQALEFCISKWQQQGVNLQAYNTLESVADLDDLRRHLGAEKISLWGISYGSHLALAAIKQMPDRLHKVIIASAEGLDQTIKYPARTDAYFQRLQTYLNSNRSEPVDYQGLIKRVHHQLKEKPVVMEWQNAGQTTLRYFFQAHDMQQLTAAMISDPGRAQQVLQLYHALSMGIHAPLENIVQRFMSPDQAISFRPMSIAMDLASGISPMRRQAIEQQSQSALLGPYLNFSLHFTDQAIKHQLDLGEGFRQNPVSDVPTLLIAGTLDGRTYIESQMEATKGLTQRQTIKVVNGGHNLFKSSPLVIKNMLLFMQDQPITDPVIHTDPLNLLSAD